MKVKTNRVNLYFICSQPGTRYYSAKRQPQRRKRKLPVVSKAKSILLKIKRQLYTV